MYQTRIAFVLTVLFFSQPSIVLSQMLLCQVQPGDANKILSAASRSTPKSSAIRLQIAEIKRLSLDSKGRPIVLGADSVDGKVQSRILSLEPYGFQSGASASFNFESVANQTALASVPSKDGLIVFGDDGDGTYVMRVKENGEIDQDFKTFRPRLKNENGWMPGLYPIGIAADSKERLLVVTKATNIGKFGNTTSNFQIYRRNNDGSADSTFGTSGVARAPIASLQNVFGVATDSQDRLLILTEDQDNRVMLRFTTDGKLDEAFGTKGKLRMRTTVDQVLNMHRDKNGLILTGYDIGSVAVVRTTEDGAGIEDFGSLSGGMGWKGGIGKYKDEDLFFGRNLNKEWFASAIDSDGNTYVAAMALRRSDDYKKDNLVSSDDLKNPQWETSVIKFSAKGIVDETFGNKGALKLSTVKAPIDMKVLSSGEVVVIGLNSDKSPTIESVRK